jgi:membrane protein DedA with SNARE-associated domain
VQLTAPIALVTGLGSVGTALTPYLSVHHPLALLVLEARDRNLLLARHVALLPYVVVGSLRRLSTDPLFFLLGRDYGDAAVRWIERKGGGRVVRVLEAVFRRAAYPMLVAFPGAVVCTLAGEIGIPTSTFLLLIVVRTLAAVFLIRWLGNLFATQVDAVLRLFDRYTLPATVASVVAVVLWILWERRHPQAPLAPDGERPGRRPIELVTRSVVFRTACHRFGPGQRSVRPAEAERGGAGRGRGAAVSA